MCLPMNMSAFVTDSGKELDSYRKMVENRDNSLQRFITQEKKANITVESWLVNAWNNQTAYMRKELEKFDAYKSREEALEASKKFQSMICFGCNIEHFAKLYKEAEAKKQVVEEEVF
jgi:hypothetical protein